MSELTMKHLTSKHASLCMVSNRSFAKARTLAARYSFEACPLDELAQHLTNADLVFSATSSKHHLISYDMLKTIMATRNTQPLVLIDMAVPRDVDPQVSTLSGVSYFDIKQLRDVSDHNRLQRAEAALRVEAIIAERLAEFVCWLGALDTRPVCMTQAGTTPQSIDTQSAPRTKTLSKIQPPPYSKVSAS
jgi:glutamyl-tRNA reductase